MTGGAGAVADGHTIRLVHGVDAVDPAAWDRCAGPDNPFVSHAFFTCVEASGCATPATGWSPHHLLLERDGTLIGVMPLYLKSHSYGEYVFDHAWADAFERAGGAYYPKLQSAVPFSPVTGPRFLVAPGHDRPAVEQVLAQAAITIAADNKLSSLHVTFTTAGEWQRLGDRFLQRTDQQFHWNNKGYDSFENFLNDLASRKRKQIRRERRDALGNGIELAALTGDQIGEEHWDAFFHAYLASAATKWGRPYLNRAFFRRLHETLRDRVLLVMARRQGRWIAGALNLIGRDTLYGRNWGALEHHPFLHFELCYYQAIDFAISRGLARVEAGAQGEHKLARGYTPQLTYSLHWIADPGLARAVARYLDQERRVIDSNVAFLDDSSPFRNEDGAG